MSNQSIRIGFVIINENYKTELESENGHRRTAFKWIVENNLKEEYYKVLGKNGIYDEEDFLMEYIGAIKLYAYGGNLYCAIPRVLNICKKNIENYFEKLGYKIINNGIYSEEKTKVKILKNDYNKTIIKKFNKEYMYNPLKDGD